MIGMVFLASTESQSVDWNAHLAQDRLQIIGGVEVTHIVLELLPLDPTDIEHQLVLCTTVPETVDKMKDSVHHVTG